MRLGRTVRAARQRRGLNQIELGERVGVKRTAIQTLERGHAYRSVTATLRNIEHTLGWARGSVEIILAGGEPLPADEPVRQTETGQAPPDIGEGLPLRVARTLTEGTTLDTTIVSIAPNAEMVVVVKGRPEATAEELKAALLAWEKRAGVVGRLGEPPDNPPETPGT